MISNITNNISTLYKQNFSSKETTCQRTTQTVALECLAEVSIAFLFCLTTGIYMPVGTLSITLYKVLNIALTATTLKIIAFFLKGENKQLYWAFEYLDWQCAFQYAFLDSGLRSILFHEKGHEWMAKSLLNYVETEIEIVPFLSGKTSFSCGYLSLFGALLGLNNVLILISAAGFLTTLFFSTLGLYASTEIKDYPSLKKNLIACSLTSLKSEITYALSSFKFPKDSQPDGHDFLDLWKRGIHPIIPIMFMIVIPLIFLCSKIFHEQES